MSGCSRRGELIGGYVLEALEPVEMEEMRRHVESCPACGAELARLARLPSLLDSVEPADVPPPALAPAVEEAVLDRFARERPRRSSGRRPRPRLLAAAAAVAAALAAVVAFAIGGEDEQSASYASARLRPLDSGSAARAYAYADAVPAGTRVTLWARGLKRPSRGVYELWCVREDGSWVSGGTFRAGADGRAQAELTAAVKPGDYHVMVVTRGAGDKPRARALLRGELRY